MSTNSIILVLKNLFVIGLEPILFNQNQILSLTCLPIPPNELFLVMAQFDSLIIFPLIVSLLIVLVFYYSMSIGILIPNFFGVKKFREKKFDSPSFYKQFNDNTEVNLINSYKPIFY